WAREGFQVRRRLAAVLVDVASRLSQTATMARAGTRIPTKGATDVARDAGRSAGETIHQALAGDPIASTERFQAAMAALAAKIEAIQVAQRAGRSPSAGDLDWVQAFFDPLSRSDLTGLADYITANTHGSGPFGLFDQRPGFADDVQKSMLQATGNAIVVLDHSGRNPKVVTDVLSDPLVTVTELGRDGHEPTR